MDAAETTPLLAPKRSRDSIWDELETFELPSRSRSRTASSLEAGADAAGHLPLSPHRLPLSPSKKLPQGAISPRAVARFDFCADSYGLAPTYFNPVFQATRPHAAGVPTDAALAGLSSAAYDERTSPTSVLQCEATPVKTTTTPTTTETPEKTVAEPTKAEGSAAVRQRLAEAQANAARKGVDGSLKWRYDSGEELTGATCAGVEFTREELMMLCC